MKVNPPPPIVYNQESLNALHEWRRKFSYERLKARRKAEPERHRAYNRKSWLKNYKSSPENWAKLAILNARRRAKRNNLQFAITVDDICVPKICPILKTEFTYGKRTETSPSLDRIRPDLGYVRGNIAVISARANRLKQDASLQEIESLIAWMRDVTKGH